MSTYLPTVAHYAEWARGQNCTVETRQVTEGELVLHAMKISAPSGATALEIFMEMDDALASTTIARLDRRLGIKSYLFR